MGIARVKKTFRGPVFRTTILIVAGFAFLFVLEGVARLFSDSWWPYPPVSVDYRQTNCLRSTASTTSTHFPDGMLKPGITFVTNRFGLRGSADDSDRKEPLVVVVAGGDFVAGPSWSEEETLPALLEKRLKERVPSLNLRVINFGHSGYNLEELNREFVRFAGRIRPDVTIVVLDEESGKGAACAAASLPVRFFLKRHSALWGWLEKHVGDFAPFKFGRGYSLRMDRTSIGVLMDEFSHPKQCRRPLFVFNGPIRLFDHSGFDSGGLDEVVRQKGYEVLDLSAEPVTMDDGSGPGNGSRTIGLVAEKIAERLLKSGIDQWLCEDGDTR